MTFKIATWNVNSLRVRLPHLLTWLADNQPDVLALQEIKLEEPVFPYNKLVQAGYQAICFGQKTYNGVAILSKHAMDENASGIPTYHDEQSRVLAVTVNGVRVINLYVPNGSSIDSDKYQYKLMWLKNLMAYLKQQQSQYKKLIVLGDFNIAPEDQDVYDPQAWKGQVLVSPAERLAWQEMIATGLMDTFRYFNQEVGHYSWWDYRAAAFRRNQGLRIDHILASETLMAQCQTCVIDKTPRAQERPSDHAPVIASFMLE